MTAASSHWHAYHQRWRLLEPPLRPDADILAGIKALVGDRTRRVLLLGVTPELARSFQNLVAVDKSAMMIANVWPGDTATQHAIEADWLALDGSLGSFSAIVGDGSCNALACPHEARQLFMQVLAHLEPGGRFVCRLFLRPEQPWSWDELHALASGPAPVNFHAFKWMLAMRIAADTESSVPVSRILGSFALHFPDRRLLAARTGWDPGVIDLIDIYRGATSVCSFPTRSELLDCLPPGFARIDIQPCGNYDLAAACPLLCCEKG